MLLMWVLMGNCKRQDNVVSGGARLQAGYPRNRVLIDGKWKGVFTSPDRPRPI